MSAAPAGAFVVDGDRWRFNGVLTFDGASTVLASAVGLPLPASGVIDMTGLEHADSAALAVVLALRRRAVAEGRSALSFVGIPPMLESLARVYGIEEFIVA